MRSTKLTDAGEAPAETHPFLLPFASTTSSVQDCGESRELGDIRREKRRKKGDPLARHHGAEVEMGGEERSNAW